MNYHWNWLIFWAMSPDGSGTYMDTLVRGVGWTLAVASLAWIIALVMGVLVGVLRTGHVVWVKKLATAYVEIFRNIPLLLQLFLWYFVFPEVVPKSLGDYIKSADPTLSTFWTAVICLGLFTSVRVAEQVRAGIGSIPMGQSMAGTALGLRRSQLYGYILLPITLRIVMPPLISEALNLVKNTSVTFTIGLLEITGAARSMQEFSFQIFESFAAATVLYMVINAVVMILMRWFEKWISVPGFAGGEK
jgi:glutamate/aspartate transport system permease protein